MITLSIIVRDLYTLASIGILDSERQHLQPLRISITLQGTPQHLDHTTTPNNHQQAAATLITAADPPSSPNQAGASLDYRLVVATIHDIIHRCHTDLLEDLAATITTAFARYPHVQEIVVELDKPAVARAWKHPDQEQPPYVGVRSHWRRTTS